MLPSRRVASSTISSLLVLNILGCAAGWHTVGPRDPSFPPRQQAQIWVNDEMVRVHALRLTTDSVRGIPYLQPLDCDTCWVSYPRDQVDSIRLGDPVGGFGATVCLILSILMVVGILTGQGEADGT